MLNQFVACARRGDDYMLFALENGRCQALPDARMVTAHHAGEALIEQLLLIEARLQLRHEAHRQVSVTRFERFRCLRSDAKHVDAHLRSYLADLVDERREKLEVADVRHRDVEPPR